MLSFLVQVVCAFLPTLLVYLVTREMSFQPLFPQYDAQTQLYIQLALPLGVFLVTRLFNSAVLAVGDKIESKVPEGAGRFLVPLATRILLTIPPVLPLLVLAPLNTYAMQLYDMYIGSVVKLLWPIVEPEVHRTLQLAYKVFVLLGVWFLAVWLLELLLRALVLVLAYLLKAVVSGVRGVVGGKASSNTEDVKKKED